jgi:hypothetical protein
MWLFMVVEVMNVVEEKLVRVVWVVVGSLLGWWKVVRREGKLREKIIRNVVIFLWSFCENDW